jgi:hypothetical protein
LNKFYKKGFKKRIQMKELKKLFMSLSKISIQIQFILQDVDLNGDI